MLTVFRYALVRFRGQILGWGLALFILGVITVARYDIMRDNQEALREVVKGSAGKAMGMLPLAGILYTGML